MLLVGIAMHSEPGDKQEEVDPKVTIQTPNLKEELQVTHDIHDEWLSEFTQNERQPTKENAHKRESTQKRGSLFPTPTETSTASGCRPTRFCQSRTSTARGCIC